MEILIATHNAHKKEEIQQILETEYQVTSLTDYDIHDEIIEDGDSFHANALIKAQYCFDKTGLPSLGDDSGLVVEELDGRPGIYSARYAGNHDFAKNMEKVLEELKESLTKELPMLKVNPIEDTYRDSLKKQVWQDGRPNLILFMGANLGNFGLDEAKNIIDHLRVGTKKGDHVLVGFDLKKNPQTILDAYHDEQGITKEFNLNLLDRINKELDGDFDRESFIHWPTYDPVSGECRSYLVSQKAQLVTIGAVNQTFEFEAFESIFTEISKKYSLSEIEHLAYLGGFEVQQNFMDSKGYFADVLWKKQ